MCFIINSLTAQEISFSISAVCSQVRICWKIQSVLFSLSSARCHGKSTASIKPLRYILSI